MRPFLFLIRFELFWLVKGSKYLIHCCRWWYDMILFVFFHSFLELHLCMRSLNVRQKWVSKSGLRFNKAVGRYKQVQENSVSVSEDLFRSCIYFGTILISVLVICKLFNFCLVKLAHLYHIIGFVHVLLWKKTPKRVPVHLGSGWFVMAWFGQPINPNPSSGVSWELHRDLICVHVHFELLTELPMTYPFMICQDFLFFVMIMHIDAVAGLLDK